MAHVGGRDHMVRSPDKYQESFFNTAKYCNKKVKLMIYTIDNMVWLLGKNLITIQPCKKLDCKFHELFWVLDIIVKNTYQLKLLSKPQIYLVFHVLLQGPAIKMQADIGNFLPSLEKNSKEECYVKDILNSKY